ncbi:MAG: DNA ligase (NAD(+)) LigA, partial [Spirochaetia bacterium]|nr:DNA ligase (NAD(+)) LigA [Spirochaetia bacterium]
RIQFLKEAGLRFSQSSAPRAGGAGAPEQIFAGQTWCVTGSFETFQPRDLAMDEVRLRGGRTTGSVTSKTTHLLAGEGAGSKLDKAVKQGTVVVTEKEFLKMIGR